MKIIFHELARGEFRNAAIYYDDQAGLGDDFIEEINHGLQQISKHHKAWPTIYPDTRAYQIKRFGFRIIYCIDDSEIVVLAICHCARRPLYWIDRLK
ncbi:MAG: type II toxin-antitoxin system RelE/ParE family toxin [Victivallaceae bacterium]|nr:type II toxin-antitoxin system RelE/ParE family toxin [Victivallaceae bacterium]